MHYSKLMTTLLVAAVTTAATKSMALIYGDTPDAKHAWSVHDWHRPLPPKITAAPGQPPSDAIILFDGTSLDNWVSDRDNEPTKWKLVDGALESVARAGYIRTRQEFGDCQLHIEWAAPTRVEGHGQGRGNSGVFLMGQYEIQVLDSYETELLPDGKNKNANYPDGMAASVYAENPPLVNACRGPGEWQSYDIVFHQPIWEGDKIKYPGSVTVFHNGVLVQDHWEMEGLTTHRNRRPLHPHATKGPLKLQDHGNPVRFRNIWIREIPSRYANTTHGGPAANEADVMKLRKETAAKLFEREKGHIEGADKTRALRHILEIIGYDNDAKYLEVAQNLSKEFLVQISGLNREQLEKRKGEVFVLREDCNTLIRNKALPQDYALRTALEKIINDNNLKR